MWKWGVKRQECMSAAQSRTASSSGLSDGLGTGKAYSTYYFIQIWRMIISRYLKKKSPKTSSPERCYFCNIVMSWAVSRNIHNDDVNHGITGGELSWEHCDSSLTGAQHLWAYVLAALLPLKLKTGRERWHLSGGDSDRCLPLHSNAYAQNECDFPPPS